MDARALDQSPLFTSLPDADRARIAERMVEQVIPAGHAIVEEGDLSYKFFVIIEGSAEVIRDGERVAVLGPGDFLGEVGLLAHERRNADVVATTPVRAAVAIGWDVREFMEEYPTVRHQIFREAKQRG